VASAAVLVCASLVLSVSPAVAALPNEPETAPAPGPYCIQPVSIPRLANVIDAKWSPDGHTLAVVRFARLPDSGPGGYVEDEELELLDMQTGAVRLMGSIQFGRPQWSPSGKYLAFWGYKADFLQVMDSATYEIVAKLTPSNPQFRWQGDTLLFIQGATIRAWTGGKTPETLGRLGDTKVPHLPDDWQWSGDGAHFTLTRYDQKAPAPDRFIGTTATQDAAPLDLPGALLTEWAPRGATLLVRYDSRIEVRDIGANTVASIPLAKNAVTEWASDGRTLLARVPRSSVAAGDIYEQEQILWPAASTLLTVPDVFGVREFSPDGRFFGGTVRTGPHDNIYAVFRCYQIVRGDPAGVPVPFVDRFASIDDGGHFIRPVAGPISQFFHPAHLAIDIAAPFGSEIVAPDAGLITSAGWSTENEGGYRVCVQHTVSLMSCLYHASAVLVSVGQRVAKSQVIALVGQSGIADGAHVHWELIQNGRNVDPLKY
jgi:murein DD-endopeptidase MepM/ murein hydrolase activator NlpD